MIPITHELCKNPRPLQPWHVETATAMACIPEEGWIRDMMAHIIYCTDAPAWFGLGSILSTLSTAAGKANVKVQRKDGGYNTTGFQMWSVIIGESGTRKTQSADIAVRILNNAKSALLMPSDGSVEGFHDALAEEQRDGIGLYYPDELSYMFDAFGRNYSKGFISWLLQTYRGELMNRALVRKGGETTTKVIREILQPRLSILGSIPPRILQAKTDKGMWSSGFMARFLFWGARRTWYCDAPGENWPMETKLTKWLQKTIVDRKVVVVIPYDIGRPIFEWIRKNVEDKDLGGNEDISSTLNRLQHKMMQIAGLIAISNRTTPCNGVMTVSHNDIVYTMRILTAMYGTFWELFAAVGGTTEGSQEKALLRYLRERPNSSREMIGEALNDITPSSLYRMIKQLSNEGILTETAYKRKGPGRKMLLYNLSEPNE